MQLAQLLIGVLFASGVQAGTVATSSVDADQAVVLDIFKKLTLISRPSGKEEGVRRFILNLIETSPEAWKRRVQHRIDDQGNLFVTLPATGRFAAQKLPAIILQPHMDMVLAVRGAPVGADLEPYFAKGVEVVEEKGWLYAKDKATSLGADDGIGMAIALRYLVNPSIEHPPLLLMFTVCEETTSPACAEIFKRAPEIAVPAGAPVLISLDGGPAGSVVYGCLGNRKNAATTRLAATPLPASHAPIRVRLSDLKGGHSGADIHRPRLNPVHAAAQVLDELAREFPALRWVSAQSGGKTKMNSIQTSVEFVVAVPIAQAKTVSARALAKLRKLVALKQDEDASKTGFFTEKVDTAGGPAVGIDAKAIRRIARAILSVPHGIVLKGPEPPYPHGLKASNNVGWLELVPRVKERESELTVGFYVRSFFEAELDRISKENLEKLKTLNPDPSKVAGATYEGGPPWLADTDSWVFRLVKQHLPQFQFKLVNGGIELRDFSKKAPDVPMLAIAPTVRDAHSPDEALEIASVGPTVAALHTLILAIGDSEEFRRAGPDKAK